MSPRTPSPSHRRSFTRTTNDDGHVTHEIAFPRAPVTAVPSPWTQGMIVEEGSAREMLTVPRLPRTQDFLPASRIRSDCRRAGARHGRTLSPRSRAMGRHRCSGYPDAAAGRGRRLRLLRHRGGYAGLSTALHLAEAGGSVILLEAREPGWGGSGRNGGQVIPGLKYDPDDMIRTYGEERGGRLLAFASSTADKVFDDLIDRHGMDVPRVREGWIQPPIRGRHRTRQDARGAMEPPRGGGAAAVQGRDRGAPRHDLLPRGLLDPRGGGVQPLSYARGLTRAALAQVRASMGGRLSLACIAKAEASASRPRRTDRAGAEVIMCTNAYAGDLVPGLRRTIVDVNSFQVPLHTALR